jgi:hypothetical protein
MDNYDLVVLKTIAIVEYGVRIWISVDESVLLSLSALISLA